MTVESKIVQIAQSYRAGDISDDILDAMAPQWVGMSGDEIRRIAKDVPPKTEEIEENHGHQQ